MKRILLLAGLLFLILSACDSKYTEAPSEEVLSMPKADCGGSPCL